MNQGGSYEWMVSEIRGDTEMCVAAGDAPSLEEAKREGMHYFMQYVQDGKTSLEIFKTERALIHKFVSE